MAFAASSGGGAVLRGSVQRRAVGVGRCGLARRRNCSVVMASPAVVLCPGQGAQAVGMGKAWAEASEAAKAVFDRADEILGSERLGAPLSSLVFDGPKEALDRTDVAQPAIFVASMACWAGMKETGVVDSAVAAGGLSLGEYSALVVGGAIKFEDALELVTLRGRAMQDAAEASNGTMAALLGATEDTAAQAVQAGLAAVSDSGQVLVAANFNAPGQVVISGSREACERAGKFASDELKHKVIMLDVAGAFHSPLMAPAAERLSQALASTEISAPTIPVMSNVTAKPHTDDPDEIRQRLVEQLTNPVRWENCVRYLVGNTDLTSSASFMEVAPGKTLMGMMRKIDKKTKVEVCDSP